ncbi:hypothetical protein [Variovorax durovernensis]|nr:MAG: hypothetical protein EKK53_01500 [Burkholderiales bacterium]
MQRKRQAVQDPFDDLFYSRREGPELQTVLIKDYAKLGWCRRLAIASQLHHGPEHEAERSPDFVT